MYQKSNMQWIQITLAMFIIAVSIYFFLLPSGIVVGSVSGLSMVLDKLLPLSISTWTLLLNMSLLVIGFIFVGKEFGAKTIYTSILLPVYLAFFEWLFPLSGSLTGNSVYDLVTYTLIIAFGQAILFNVNASSGGLDIVGKIISKYTHMEIGKALSISGMITAMSSILVYDVGTLIVSLIGTFANGQAVDYFNSGFHKKKKICILSDEYPVIQDFIMNKMHRGVTLYKAMGGYHQEERIELVTIMTVNEYKKLLDYLHRQNFRAFVTVSTVNEVIGTWNIEKKKTRTAL